MELRGYCDAVKDVEKIVEKMVKIGQAECIKDSSKPFSLPIGPDVMTESKIHVRVYQIFAGVGPLFFTQRVNVRFWYDLRANKASIKISKEGIELLAKKVPNILSMDVIETTGKLEIEPDNINM